MKLRPTVIAIGDTHFPWARQRTLDRIYSLIEAEKPYAVVQLGDLYDMYSWSRFARTQCIYTPKQEIELGRKYSERMWDLIRKISPKSKLFQLRGNHDERPYKSMLNSAPELEPFMAFSHLWTFDGVETVMDSRDTLELAGVTYMHGFKKHGEHALEIRGNCVVGHLHVGGTVFLRLGGETIFECNAGWTGNPDAVPLSYTALRKHGKTTQGVAKIDRHGPRFIAL